MILNINKFNFKIKMAEEEHVEDIKAYQWASFVGIFFLALLFALLPL